MDIKRIAILSLLLSASVSHGFSVVTNGASLEMYATNINEVVALAQQNEADITAVEVSITGLVASAEFQATNTIFQAFDTAQVLTNTSFQEQIDAIDLSGLVTGTEFQATNAIFEAFDTTQVLTNANLQAQIDAIDTSGYVPTATFTATNAIFQAFDDDQVLTNANLQAQIDAGSGSSATYPVSPYGLILAHTFDSTLTNDWWGALTTTNTGVVSAFDSVRGGYADLAGGGDNLKGPVSSVSFGNNFTLFGFQYFTAAGFGNGYISSFGSYSLNGCNIRFYDVATGNARARIANASTGIDLQGANKTTAGWYSVALTYDSAATPSAILYVNGTQEDSGSITAPSFTSGFYLGADHTGTAGDHDIDNVYVWDRTLTSNEVVRLHNLEANGQYGVQGLRKP